MEPRAVFMDTAQCLRDAFVNLATGVLIVLVLFHIVEMYALETVYVVEVCASAI